MSMTGSTRTRTAANYSTISSVRMAVMDSWLLRSSFRTDSDGPVKLELPEQWLWDIIDEFIYQYQVFCTWRSKVKTKTEDELVMLGPVRVLETCSS